MFYPCDLCLEHFQNDHLATAQGMDSQDSYPQIDYSGKQLNNGGVQYRERTVQRFVFVTSREVAVRRPLPRHKYTHDQWLRFNREQYNAQKDD